MTKGKQKSSRRKSVLGFALFQESFTNLKNNEPLILAAATAFFATFSLSPIIVILINVFGIYFRNEEIKKQLIQQLEGLFGRETSRYIEGIVVNVNEQEHNWIVAILGFIFLFFVATTLLKIVRQSIHNLWNIKRRHVDPLKYNFKERSIGVFIIFMTGTLAGLSFIMDTSLALLYDYLKQELPTVQVVLIRFLNIVFSVLVSTIWFSLLLKILPDAKIRWRVATAGGFLTALLFSFGKFILGKLLLYNAIADIFGPSASFVLILLFIFYSSLILYFGASFTHAFAIRINMPIHPGKSSEEYEVRSVKEDNDRIEER